MLHSDLFIGPSDNFLAPLAASFQLLAIKPLDAMLLSEGAMAKTMIISGNNHNHALIHNSKSVPAELLKLSRESGAGFSSSDFQIKDAGGHWKLSLM